MKTTAKTSDRNMPHQTLLSGGSGVLIGALTAALAMAPLPGSQVAHAAGEAMADYTSIPLDSAFSAPPMAMLTLSNDHQLYYKAYDDYSDLNGDGVLELTYNHAIEYYGYFDPAKCYSYEDLSSGGTNDGRFEPKAMAVGKYCDTVAGEWSGNFLNWGSMHRMDIVRKSSYGGKRYKDTTTETVVERVFLPNDAHSSAKYYNGLDIAKLTPFDPPAGDNTNPAHGITLCNTTLVASNTGYSQDIDTAEHPPLIRVAQGNNALWTGNERWQCRWSEEKLSATQGINGNNPALSGLYARSQNPSRAAHGLAEANGSGPDFVARVLTCVDGLIGSEDCRAYPGLADGVKKPVGLLQKFGGDNSISFGLITGSYEQNLSGGVLRKNVTSIDSEINDDGTFDNTVTHGIIKTLDTFRIFGYSFQSGHYLDAFNGGDGGDTCTFGLSDFPEGQCSNWGNPQTEAFLEGIRYLSGAANPIADYQADDDVYLSGLSTAPWNNTDLITEENACAKLNIISFNASYASQDGGALPDLEPQATNQTNVVGDNNGEQITGNDFFVGSNGGAGPNDNDLLCTAKTVGDLADVTGLCPEAPRVGGSYKIAGLAYDAHVTDQYPSVESDQFIDTYGVTLSPSVPKIKVDIPDSDNTVALLPACINYNPITQFGTPQGSCTLVDFKVVSQTANTGKFYVNWEDSEAGGDYDQDMWGTIEYELDATGELLTVTTDVHAQSTPHPMGFGYIIGGTTQDGFHAHSGINNFKYPDRTGPNTVTQTDTTGVIGCPNPFAGNNICGQDGFGNPDVTSTASAHTYTVGSGSAGVLELPLYYAAKWGSFEEQNDSNPPRPDLPEEWDRKDNFDATSTTPDGIPDSYFLVTIPGQLVAALTAVFEDLLAKSSQSGASAAVIANSSQGFGAVFQAYYQPELRDDTQDKNKVRWIGDAIAIFIDDFGLLREDSNNNDRLDDYQTDLAVAFKYDSDAEVTKLIRYTSSSATEFKQSGATEHDLADFKPIWNAGSQLAALSDDQAINQRASYTDAADTGRYILTWMDSGDPPDGKVQDSEVKPFTTASVTATNFGFFGVPDQATAQNIVKYTRGDSRIPGYRNRTADVDGDGSTEVWRHGDIIHAPPLAVGPPSANFDILQGDEEYAEFKDQYKDRRIVLITPANDGLIHAYNGGSFDEVTREFKKTDGSGSGTAHPLGSELWAYAPMNLLPHLQWLADPDYTHVYYMDGRPQAFDAKIFSDDADHPNGWGTVLVVGMRLGGGAFEIDHDQDATTATWSTRSAYVVLDITNPEKAPKVLAEITDPKLGFTTSSPAVIFREDAGVNTWFLAFGSGPTEITDFTSTQNAHLFNYNLLDREMHAGWPQDLGIATSFVGDVTGADFDIFQVGDDFFTDPKYLSDAWYFGVVTGTPDTPSGKLYRWKRTGNNLADHLKLLLDPGDNGIPAGLRRPNQPFLNRPTLGRDDNQRIWVYTGSGRYEVKEDKESDHPQSFYGIQEPVDNLGELTYAEVSRDDLVDTTDIVVFADDDDDGNGKVEMRDGSDVVIDGETIEDFLELEDAIAQTSGWYHALNPSGSGNPSARSLSKAGLTSGVLVYGDFTPAVDLCEPSGTSGLNVVYYKTGTGHPGVLLPGEVVDGITTTRIDLTEGRAMQPVFHTGTGGGRVVTHIIVNNSDRSIDIPEFEGTGEPGTRTSWHEILIGN